MCGIFNKGRHTLQFKSTGAGIYQSSSISYNFILLSLLFPSLAGHCSIGGPLSWCAYFILSWPFCYFVWAWSLMSLPLQYFLSCPCPLGRKGGGCWLRGAPVAPLLVDHHWASHKICDDGYINYCIYWTNKKRFGSLLFGSTSILMHSYFAVLCPFLVLFYNWNILLLSVSISFTYTYNNWMW